MQAIPSNDLYPALASLAAVSWGVAAFQSWHRRRVGPLRMLSRGLDHVRAGMYTFQDMMRAAWERSERYSEHLERAKRER